MKLKKWFYGFLIVILINIMISAVSSEQQTKMDNNKPVTAVNQTNQNNIVLVNIEGRIQAPPGAASDWYFDTRVHLDGGRHNIGFVQPSGSFIVSAVPSGSYLVEVINPVYVFQPVRVDVNSKGKIRARRFNALQPNAVKVVAYPLQMSSVGKAGYFYQREQLRTLDLLMNPTLLFMVLPLLLVMVLPKLMDTNDEDLQRDMQTLNALNPRQNLPDMSEMLSSMSLLGGSNRGNSASGRGGSNSANDERRQRLGGSQRYQGNSPIAPKQDDGFSYSTNPSDGNSATGCYGNVNSGGSSGTKKGARRRAQ